MRVWVPGCATGEEAYTLAMVFQEEVERQQAQCELIVFATDMDQAALALAREGIYPKAIDEDVSDARLDRYFRHDGEHYRVLLDIRDRVVFAQHNLLRDPPFGRLQLISCRNVLIYLDRALQEHSMRIFRYACRDDGFLFLGQSETANLDWFTPLNTRHRIFRVRPGANEARPAVFDTTSGGAGHAFSSRPAHTPVAPTASQLHVDALETLGPPSVLLDERWNVLHLSPSAARFFQQGGGPLATRATELVRPELRDALHALLLRASDSGDAHVSRLVPVPFDGAPRGVAMVVQTRANAPHLLLTFLDTGDAGDAAAARSFDAAPDSASLSATLQEAQQHIETMREDAALKMEELRAVNEELLSLNEEHRSTTEELETSREELQSTNEELQTINKELKLRLDQVSRAHSDIENLMLATNVATVFLSLDLRITRFTRQLEDIFTIKPRDLERPIGDLRHTLEYGQLEDDSRQVLQTLSPIERHTTNRAGRAYIVRLSPYRTADDHIVDGVVVTFVDVTALKEAEQALRASERQLDLELATMRRLHAMTLHVATAPHLHDALEHLVAAAVDLHGADQGHVQLYDPAAHRLQIVAQRGCPSAFLEQSATDHHSVAGAEHERRAQGITQIADVLKETDDATRDLAEHGSYRAIQSSPLLSRDGELLGVLSVHFRNPHQFTERDTQLATLLGRQAGDLLEARMRQLEVSASRHEASDVRNLLGRLVTIQEEERRRIARDIHDQLGQSMTALRMQLEALRLRSERYGELSADVLRADGLAGELDENIDFLTWELRPAALDRLGLSAAVADLVRGWSDRFHIAADYHAHGSSTAPLTTQTSANVYRIIQEALHNVQKHAEATRVSVVLSVGDGHLSAVIEDNGRGFDPGLARSPQSGGLGLVSIRERAILVGGEFSVDSSPGEGTSIFVRVPVAPAL